MGGWEVTKITKTKQNNFYIDSNIDQFIFSKYQVVYIYIMLKSIT